MSGRFYGEADFLDERFRFAQRIFFLHDALRLMCVAVTPGPESVDQVVRAGFHLQNHVLEFVLEIEMELAYEVLSRLIVSMHQLDGGDYLFQLIVLRTNIVIVGISDSKIAHLLC